MKHIEWSLNKLLYKHFINNDTNIINYINASSVPILIIFKTHVVVKLFILIKYTRLYTTVKICWH